MTHFPESQFTPAIAVHSVAGIGRWGGHGAATGAGGVLSDAMRVRAAASLGPRAPLRRLVDHRGRWAAGVHTFSRGPGVHRVLSRPRCSSRLRAWDWMSTSEAWLLPRSTGRPVRSSIGDWRTSPWRSARSRTHSPRSQGPVADYLRGWPHGVRPGPHPSRGGASGAGRGTLEVDPTARGPGSRPTATMQCCWPVWSASGKARPAQRVCVPREDQLAQGAQGLASGYTT